MTNDLVKQSIAELQDLVRCRCHEAYKVRGLHDPDCECDNADAVQVLADRIEELEAKLTEKDGELGLLRAHVHRLGYAGSQFEALLLPRGSEGPEYRALHTATARRWREAYDRACVIALKGAPE
jgi:hypothetical protein